MKASLVSIASALAALLIAIPVSADPTKPEKQEKTIIKIIKSGDGTADKSDIDTDVVIKECSPGARKVDTMDETKDKDGKTQKTRLILCAKGEGEADQAQLLSALEKARERLANLDALSAETKAKALAGIDEQLNRLKSQAPSAK